MRAAAVLALAGVVTGVVAGCGAPLSGENTVARSMPSASPSAAPAASPSTEPSAASTAKTELLYRLDVKADASGVTFPAYTGDVAAYTKESLTSLNKVWTSQLEKAGLDAGKKPTFTLVDTSSYESKCTDGGGGALVVTPTTEDMFYCPTENTFIVPTTFLADVAQESNATAMALFAATFGRYQVETMNVRAEERARTADCLAGNWADAVFLVSGGLSQKGLENFYTFFATSGEGRLDAVDYGVSNPTPLACLRQYAPKTLGG